ncbi:hypothetical protein [Filimonas lacunae]|nr:hypothetical protein [Filimonas lacunae]
MKNRISFCYILLVSLLFSITSYAQQTPAVTTPKFPGGPIAWMKFVNKFLDNDTTVQNLPPGTYRSTFRFDVDVTGNISHITEEGNLMQHKISLLYIMQKSPYWIPAYQNGRAIPYRHVATINFEMFPPDEDTLPASFIGGKDEWKKYLMNAIAKATITFPNAPAATYNITTHFTVDSTGRITNILLDRKYGYGIDAAIIRVLQDSPRWNPGTYNSIKVATKREEFFSFEVMQPR